MGSYWTGTGAELYDIAFDWRRDREADFAERCVDAYGSSTGAVLDLACGGGRFLEEMAGRGWRVAGVDISGRMAATAQRRLGGSAELETACMSEFTLAGPFDLATCWLDSLGYLKTNEKIIRHLRHVADVLAPGGLYLLDVGFSAWAQPFWSGMSDGWRPVFQDGWTGTRGEIEVYHDGCDGPPFDGFGHLYTEHMYFRRTDRTNGRTDERTYTSRKRALHPQEFAALVEAAGAFEIAAWHTGQLDLSERFDSTDGKGRAIVVLRRRK